MPIKMTVVLLLCVSLCGCGGMGRSMAWFTGKSEACIDGVTYIQFTSGVTVKYRPDGRVWTCQ